MAEKYYFREHFTFDKKNISANQVGEELKRISDKNKGKLKPIYVIKEAKDKKHILNNYFEWNDNIAGNKFRLQQARDIIANIVEVVVIEGVQSKQRSFYSISDKESKEKCYVTLKEAITKDDYRVELINKIITNLTNTTELLKMFKQKIK